MKEAKAERIEIEDELREFYRVIDCDWIDITQRRIGGKPFSIVCDDEGLFVANPKISAIDLIGNPMLVGNLLILSANNTDGELESLTEAEAAHVLKCVKKNQNKKLSGRIPDSDTGYILAETPSGVRRIWPTGADDGRPKNYWRYLS